MACQNCGKQLECELVTSCLATKSVSINHASIVNVGMLAWHSDRHHVYAQPPSGLVLLPDRCPFALPSELCERPSRGRHLRFQITTFRLLPPITTPRWARSAHGHASP